MKRFQQLGNLTIDEASKIPVNNEWQQVQTIYYDVSKKVLGFKRQVHKEWITPETWKLTDERKKLNNKICQTHSERL